MKKTRYFDSASKFNIAVNFICGNDFPLTEEEKTLSFAAFLWITFVRIGQMLYVLTGLAGTIYFANLNMGDMFTKSGSMGALCIELMIPTIHLNLRRNEWRNLISKYNDILIDSNELRGYINDTFKPYKIGFIVYIILVLSVNVPWAGMPIFRLFDNDKFTYVDYTIPAYLPGEPFGPRVFFAGVAMTVFGACSINFAKIGVDLYFSYFILVLTAQYKYVRAQLSAALRQDNDCEQDESTVVAALQKCVQHHCAVIEAGQILGKLLALLIGATYIGFIFKFCFLAFGLVTLTDAIVHRITYVLYSFACLMQVYLLCSCFQGLLDTSTSVTEDAFHENWHGRGNIVKKIFCTIEVSSQIECRISAYRIVELVVPTMATILSESYSLCLLLLTVK